MSENNTVALALAVISLAGTLAGIIFAWLRSRRSDGVKQQRAVDARAEIIARQTTEELERLYARIEKLEAIVDKLQKADELKQKTIDTQADELDRTNRALEDVRSVLLNFERRVQIAWTNGQKDPPTLTDEERSLLENTIPKATHLTRGDHP